MKKILSLSLIGILLLQSCGKDDEPAATPGTGQLTIGDETYTLSYGYIEDYGSNGNDSFDVDITLTSAAVDANTTTLTNFSIVYLDLNTSVEGVLESGTYTFGEERDVKVMVAGLVAGGVNVDSEGDFSGGQGFPAIDGTATVAVTGSTYTITFTLTGENDASASGTYTGSLEDLDI